MHHVPRNEGKKRPAPSQNNPVIGFVALFLTGAAFGALFYSGLVSLGAGGG